MRPDPTPPHVYVNSPLTTSPRCAVCRSKWAAQRATGSLRGPAKCCVCPSLDPHGPTDISSAPNPDSSSARWGITNPTQLIGR